MREGNGIPAPLQKEVRYISISDMINPRIAAMRPYTADRKRQLFSGLATPVTADLTIGEPQHTPDPRVVELVNSHAAEALGRYPKTKQESYLTEAIIRANLVSKALHASIDESQVLAGCGSGELLYSFATASLDPQKPYVLIPNPAYQVYSAATEYAGGIPFYFDLRRENGFQPDLASIPEDVLTRTSLCYLNSPNNPCAVCYSEESLREVVLLARKYGFAVASDECYIEIYFDRKPTSILEVCAALDGDNSFRHVVAFDTLSKRSSLPGLRSGSMVGDARLVSSYLKMRFSERKVLPNNVQRASAYAWTNFEDVRKNRELYRDKIEIFRSAFSGLDLPITLPSGTFYIWLDVSSMNPDDEAFALSLAQATGILTFPGSYFSVAGDRGNPGAGFIRMALIDTVESTKKSMAVLADYVRNYASKRR
jgi:N-succinyldiaminopimelate aminotransferase